MTDAWAVVLEVKDGDAAGALFDRGVEVLEEGERLWLRGVGGDERVVKRSAAHSGDRTVLCRRRRTSDAAGKAGSDGRVA